MNAERALLSKVALTGKGASELVASGVTEDHFVHADCVEAWRFIITHAEKYAKQPDVKTILDAVPRFNLEPSDEGLDFLRDRFAETLKRRETIEFMREVLAPATNDPDKIGTLDELLREAADRVSGLPLSNGNGKRRLLVRAFSEISPRKIVWLVPGMLPVGNLALIAGVGGTGKSTYMAKIAANVSRGKVPDGVQGGVLLISYEDPSEEVVRPRLEVAGADMSRIHEVSVDLLDGGQVRLPTDFTELRSLIKDTQARLLVIDPIVAAISTELDAHKEQHVRAILGELVAVMEETRCVGAMVGHLNKAPSTAAYIRIANSAAFWNASRSVVLVTKEDDEDEDDRAVLVTQCKANWTKESPVQRHELVVPKVLPLDEDGNPIEVARMDFIEYAHDVRSGSVLIDTNGKGADKADKTLAASLFIGNALRGGEWTPSSEVKAAAAEVGIKERTLKLAAHELDVDVKREGFPSVTYWRIAAPEPVRQKDEA